MGEKQEVTSQILLKEIRAGFSVIPRLNVMVNCFLNIRSALDSSILFHTSKNWC